MDLVPGGVYCVTDAEGAHLLKVIEFEGAKVHMRMYPQPPSCPHANELTEAPIAKSIPTLPMPREWLAKQKLILVAIRQITDEELAELQEIKRVLRPPRKEQVQIIHTRPLQRVHAGRHPPLFVDASTIERFGAEVRFVYVFSHTAGNETADEYRQSRSSAIEARIRCSDMTIATGSTQIYSGPEATGTIEETRPAHSLDRWNPVKPRGSSGGTAEYLAGHLCR